MSSYDIIYLSKKAEELGFVRDTLEKVTRLSDVLEYMNTNPILKESLALKGGTAINLIIFNLPRLSVDIDMDYLINNRKEEMLKHRELINNTINRYMLSQGYTRNAKTKSPHSLDSWVYDYIGSSGNRDNLKIEINYSLRAHILPAEERPIITEHFSEYKVRTLDPIEIFGSKINALLSRAAARDLYDTGNMIYNKLFNEFEEKILKRLLSFMQQYRRRRLTRYLIPKQLIPSQNKKLKPIFCQ